MKPGVLVFVLLVAAASSQAHVTLQEPNAVAGAGYKAVVRIGHGCEGTATHTVKVQIPPGFRGAKPMPKPGWDITIQRAPLAQPYESHSRKISDDVVAITWEAKTRDNTLPDSQYDEFVLRGQAPEVPGPIWFKVLQLCERGQWDWSEVPVSGISTQGLKAPAVLLQVQPKAVAGDVH